MELLAPAGGMEQLRAAVAFGADAVYLAAERFGMRARAANFRMDEIPAAVAFAHDHGVKVHVTCNILMHPDDIDGLPPFFRALDAAGVDAFIIGDVGAFAVAGEVAPRVERHVSTQASVANATAARVWHSLGASRVVCAREMSLADIARLRQDAPPDLEIEAFAHGAMCMAVSGRCLISSYLTGRSGNKGHCTQPCRWSYQLGAASPAATRPDEPAGGDLGRPSPASVVELPQSENAIGIQGGLKSAPTEFAAGRPVEFLLEEEKRPGEFFPIEEDDRGTFIMNAKDLNMLAHLQALADAGVDSIKIEGRNKKAFYVATVVGAYRRVLDGEPPDEVADELLAVSHRPYGTGFYFSEAEQAPAYDGYEQETMHIADVVAGDPHHLYLLCRNRFAEGDELEVLAPHEPSRRLIVRDLHWLNTFGPDNHDEDAPATVEEALTRATTADWEAAAVANRSCNLYRILVEGGACGGAPAAHVPEGSFLRKRTFRRSARHGS
ncbi:MULTISPECIES: peptidase U32 family protein [Adlercreutzia]|mgnify:FL=1|nr:MULTISPECIES: peptidase U32 family protein [Adlercreutzia]MCB6760153.1 U32 family peptidase [Adlercreutzia equolifaciens]MEE0307382.1 peptidase U32 family protein [Adlercreutzia sp.]MCB6975628.1 U32 family peptidase [Adlercreutzia equolifaciens]MCQ5070892.1 U32 family peptidase [Adlercreutzia sp. DFI.6.23]MDE8683771.1 U32 family peptidase [Adlercreutzia rubneri]